MKVLPLNPDVEPLFWDHVYQDVPHYYFFILDMHHDRASTEIFLVLDEQNIQGMMMIYNKRIIQLRGSVAAVKALLPQVTIKKVEIQGLPEHKPIIYKKFKKMDKAFDLTLMTVKKEDNTLYTAHTVERLTTGDAHHIAALMRQGFSAWWGDITGEDIASKMDKHLYMGIRIKNQLVSIGGATVDVWGSKVDTVVTHKDH